MNVNLRALIGKLNHETRAAVEGAAGLCMSRTHYNVEIEHYLMKLLDVTDGDFQIILKQYGVDRSRLARDLTEALDELKTGNARTPTLSPSLVDMLTVAWTLGSVDYGAGQVRSGHTILALVADPDLGRMVGESTKEFAKISAEDLQSNFETLLGESVEEARGARAEVDEAPRKKGGPTPNLDAYTHNLSEQAEAGKLDPVLGRDTEIRQMVDILTRRRQNNPILVGEAGVGKTAVVEGFVMRIAQGDVPPPLRNVRVRSLDLALLQAGAGVKGEFENRLKGLIAEVKSSPTPIILFIDEAHTMIGAGGTAGQGDAANLLKPALARGELRTIAATTWSEYKKYFEKDPALSRRFQLVKVEEPTEDLCIKMMRGVVPFLERHHEVRILNDGMHAAVRLAHRYLPDRQLPDKAVSVLDTACARLALGQTSTPAALEDAQRTLDDLEVQHRVLSREQATGTDHSERLAEIAADRAHTVERLEALRERWEEERELVKRVRALREALEATVDGADGDGAAAASGRTGEDAGAAAKGTGNGAGPDEASQDVRKDPEESEKVPPATGAVDRESNPGTEESSVALPSDPGELRDALEKTAAELETLQGENPLVPAFVDAELVGQVISGWTGIPVGRMVRDELATILELEKHLQKRIIGQDHALEIISHRIRTSKAGIEDPKKPIGVFMLVGPSGVGKTETALSLSELLYGGEHNLISINMSEFQEAHTVSSLKGSPPGYVGYGEGGVLTEAVRRRPYSVLLLDEIEKAHPDVLELFFQVFDKGIMEDGEGRQIDFKNCVIIMTTNVGTETIMRLCADPETMPSQEGLAKALKPELDETFQPAFMGRTVVIPYFPLRDEALRKIIDLKVGKVQRRLEAVHDVSLELAEAVKDAIAARCTEVESGARNIDNIMTNTVLPSLGKLLLTSLVAGEQPERVEVTLGDGGMFEYQVS